MKTSAQESLSPDANRRGKQSRFGSESGFVNLGSDKETDFQKTPAVRDLEFVSTLACWPDVFLLLPATFCWIGFIENKMPHTPQYPDNVMTTKKKYLHINMRRKWTIAIGEQNYSICFILSEHY